MSIPQSQQAVSKLYQGVIDDVMTNIREAFLDEGVDEQVLHELRILWESKLVATKAVSADNHATESSSTAKNGTSSGAKNASVVVPLPQQVAPPPPAPPQPQISSDPNTLIPIQITMPVQPNDPHGVAKSITLQVPASCIHNNRLQEILQLPQIQSTLSLPSDLAQVNLQNQVNQVLGIATRQQQPSVITPHPQHSQMLQGLVQLDGQAAGGDSSEDEDEEEDDDDDLDDDVDDNDDQREEEPEDEGQDEEPLNSGDDVSDAEDSNDKLYEIDNVVVCQYDKITRTRNKWKFHLKDGIMNLNGKDFVFQKANGDAEW